MQIIVQAGGKGTRLEHLTHNRPKCLVSLHNKPLLFHLFDKYPNSRFVIIGDYKYDVLERYLATFAKHINYKLLRAEGEGNIRGIKEALDYISPQEKLMLVWADLVLADDFKPETLPAGNYVGLLPGIRCAWRLEKGKLEKKASSTCGVAGCFIFNNKQALEGVAQTGSFTQWLQKSGLQLTPLSMARCTLVGSAETLDKLEDIPFRCCPHHRIAFTEDTVKKEGILDKGRKLMERETAWYRKMAQYGYPQIPEVYCYRPLTLQRIDGKNISKHAFTEAQKTTVIRRLIAGLKQLHDYETRPADRDDLLQEYYTQIIEQLSALQPVIPFAQEPWITINGKKCKNPLVFKEDFKAAVTQKLMDTVFAPIHGDCTFTHTLMDKSGAIYFIGARGYFGKQEVFGDVRYDWAKLYHSMAGNLEGFRNRDFRLSISNKAVVFHIASSGWESLAPALWTGLSPNFKAEIRLIHAILWLSLAARYRADYDSMCLAFYSGVYLLQEFLPKSNGPAVETALAAKPAKVVS